MSPADLLLQPARDSWPTYHGDYSGRHHSRLTQITPDNVAPARRWRGRSRPMPTQQIKATPILVNGVIYVTTPDNIWAIDARSGRQLWRYTYPANDGFHIGHRGAAVYKDSVYPDDARRASGRARRAHRQGEVERRDRRLEARLLVDQRAAASSATTCSSACPATSTICPASCKSFDPETGTRSGPSTARRRPARPIRSAAAPPAGRCG